MNNETNFQVAFEVITQDFFAQAQERGMTYEEAKEFLLKNKHILADRIKGLMAETNK